MVPVPLLDVRALTVGHGARVLLRDWSAHLGPGVALVTGGEGSGKSTLLRVLAGGLAPLAGSLALAGCTPQDDPQGWSRLVCHTEPRTDAHDSVTAHDYLAGLQERFVGFDAGCVPALIEALGLSEHQHKPIYMLSTGSRRKLWFLGACASSAPLTLVDEPFAALDRRSVGVVGELLRAQARAGRRIWVLADHGDPEGVPLAQRLDLGGW